MIASIVHCRLFAVVTIYSQSYFEHVRRALREKMDAQHKPTSQSWRYRKRAAELARAADEEIDVKEQTELVKQALQWISLAENDEFMAVHRPVSNDN